MRRVLFLFVFLPLLARSQNASLPPEIHKPYLDNNGKPLSGGKLYTCVAHTSCPGNPQATYQDSGATISNGEFVTLDYTGYAPIFLNVLWHYKVVAFDRNNVRLWDVDDVFVSRADSLVIPLTVPQGGSGAASLSGILQGNGTSPFTATAIGPQLTYLRSKPNVSTPGVEFSALPYWLTSDYDFPAQSLATSLTSGVQATITLSPVPVGLNASDTNHAIRINDTAIPANSETVLIQPGGTAVSGSLSPGTIKVTTVFNHTAYTITSAAHGIIEAAQVCQTAGGGNIKAPSGQIVFSAAILFAHDCHFSGQRGATVLKVVDHSYSQTNNWLQATTSAGYWVVIGTKVVANQHAGNVSFSDFTLDLNGANQTGLPAAPGGISMGGGQGLVDNVIVQNATNTVGGPPFGGPFFIPVQLLASASYSIVDKVKVFNLPCGGVGAGAFIDLGLWNSVNNSQAFNVCSPGAFIASSPAVGSTWINNVYTAGASTFFTGTQQFCSDSADGTIFIGNKCNGNGPTSGIGCFTTTTDSSVDTIATSFSDNFATNAQYGYMINGSTSLGAFSQNTKIQGGQVLNSGTGVLVADNVKDLKIVGVDFIGNTVADLLINASVDHSITGLNVFGNSFTSNGAAQININHSGSSAHPLYDSFISGNHFTGAATAILVNASAALSKFILTGNIFRDSSVFDFHWLGGSLNTMATTPAANGAYCSNITNAGSPQTNGCVGP